MNTLAALGIAGAAGVALFLIERKTAAPVAPAVSQSIPGGTDSLHQFTNQVADTGGRFVAGALGPAGGVVAKPLMSAGRSYVNGTVSSFKTAGSGFVNIAKGNVWTGTKQVATGAVQSAYTATGAKSVVDFAKSIL